MIVNHCAYVKYNTTIATVIVYDLNIQIVPIFEIHNSLQYYDIVEYWTGQILDTARPNFSAGSCRLDLIFISVKMWVTSNTHFWCHSRFIKPHYIVWLSLSIVSYCYYCANPRRLAEVYLCIFFCTRLEFIDYFANKHLYHSK